MIYNSLLTDSNLINFNKNWETWRSLRTTQIITRLLNSIKTALNVQNSNDIYLNVDVIPSFWGTKDVQSKRSCNILKEGHTSMLQGLESLQAYLIIHQPISLRLYHNFWKIQIFILKPCLLIQRSLLFLLKIVTLHLIKSIRKLVLTWLSPMHLNILFWISELIQAVISFPWSVLVRTSKTFQTVPMNEETSVIMNRLKKT